MAKLPKKLGDLIDLAYAARAERLELQKVYEDKISTMKAREKDIEDAIINGFTAQDIEGAKGATASASVSSEVIPQIDLENGGWPAVWAWAKKNDAMDLFEKRLARVATRDRLDAGQKIPGVKVFVAKKLSLTKISK